MDLHTSAEMIRREVQAALDSKKGFLVGRNGTIEIETLVSNRISRILERNAGVFPLNEETIYSWIQETKDAIVSADILAAGWYAPLAADEFKLLKSINATAKHIPLRALEPYYYPEFFRWTSCLKGRRVAIVNSFAESALEQTKKAAAIWPNHDESILPDATWIPIRTGYSPVLAQGRAEWPVNVKCWKDAVAHVVQQVVESDAEVVLIGCGGLGMIIGARLKALGKVCIVLGGAIQVLFGIKGRRWEHHEIISNFWNDAWIWPLLKDTPAGADAVERRCYWE